MATLIGAPYVTSPGYDPGYDRDKGLGSNEFTFDAPNGCALGAHIRKVNPRVGTEVSKHKRIVRNGIPYGADYDDDKQGRRGLLFACYQSSIENGFREIQIGWSNKTNFPRGEDKTAAGFDPIIGQPATGEQFYTTVFDENNKKITPPFEGFQKLIELKGGEYFFVPSISALLNTLGSP